MTDDIKCPSETNPQTAKEGPEAGQKAKRRSRLSVVESTITLICSIVVLVSIFLPWVNSASVLGQLSGWNILGYSTHYDAPFLALGVAVGGFWMAISAIPAFIMALTLKGSKVAVGLLGLSVVVGSGIATICGAKFILTAAQNSIDNHLTYGIFMVVAGAMLGVLFGLWTAFPYMRQAFSKGKK
jgi:hypothetical protein